MREAVLDANVLLRYLTDEPRELADRATDILQAAQGQGVELVLAPLTVAEVVYVLESVYRWQRREIADGLLDLFSASVLQVLEQAVVSQALTWYREIPTLHFADAYIAALAVARAENSVVSFDRDLRRVPGLLLVQESKDLRQ